MTESEDGEHNEDSALYLRRMHTLRDQGIPFAVSQYELGKLNWNTFYRVEINCGTAACLGGWVCMMKDFRNEGLKLVPHPDDEEHGEDWAQYIPAFKGAKGFRALENFFGLNPMEAEKIFGGGSAGGFTQRRDRIDKVIDRMEN